MKFPIRFTTIVRVCKHLRLTLVENRCFKVTTFAIMTGQVLPGFHHFFYISKVTISPELVALQLS